MNLKLSVFYIIINSYSPSSNTDKWKLYWLFTNFLATIHQKHEYENKINAIIFLYRVSNINIDSNTDFLEKFTESKQT